MIPKKLHYCWFGNNPKPKTFQDCLQSWQQFCPDFEIIEWNEKNTQSFANAFYKNALRKKKYAFVADYIRAKVLFDQGGIYLDTDMLLLKPIDDLLQNDFFIAEEVKNRINFAIFGTISNHRFLEQMLNFYNKNEFNGFAPPVITHTFSPVINQETIVTNEIIFSSDYFYPLLFENRLEHYTKYIQPESYAVHLWDHSWGKTNAIGFLGLLENLKTVSIDFLFYGYSFSYFKRYTKEFSRKIIQLAKAKITHS
ncbi:glycosyltransferase [Flavobacterium sp.]|uniref:glycosyltransferase n=1 Tax=Flavobacterium sp. TaxID=239 RepID=UPI002869FFAB|nr:glycosyltransferase [Flavobacterium sp.]